MFDGGLSFKLVEISGEKAYQVIEPHQRFLNNFGLPTSVTFVVTVKALVRFQELFPGLEVQPNASKEDKLLGLLTHFFDSPALYDFWEVFSDTFYELGKVNLGFPSFTHKAETILIHLMSWGSANVRYSVDKYKVIKLGFNIENFLENEFRNKTLITHELYHVYNAFHNKEHEQMKELQRWEDRLHSATVENRNKIEAWMDKIENKVGEGFDIRKYNHLTFFYGMHTGTKMNVYWNVIGDLGLNILAVRLNNANFIIYEIETYEEVLKEAKKRFARIQELLNGVTNQPEAYQFMASYMHLMQFIAAYVFMPFNLIAYLTYTDHPDKKIQALAGQAKRLVQAYESEIKKYGSRTPSGYFKVNSTSGYDTFFEFWSFFKTIPSKMKKLVSSSALEIEDTIHNELSMKATKEGFKLLTRLFKELYDSCLAAEKYLRK